MTEGDPHRAADDLCGEALARVIPAGWYVRGAKPIRLPPNSKPEPGRCVVRGAIRDYSRRSPGPGDISLVTGVADRSLNRDRARAMIHARSGIPVYWIVNLVDRIIEARTNPTPSGSTSRVDYSPGQHVPTVIDGIEVARVAVANILP